MSGGAVSTRGQTCRMTGRLPRSPEDSADEIATLVRSLHETDLRLRELTGSGAAAWLHSEGAPALAVRNDEETNSTFGQTGEQQLARAFELGAVGVGFVAADGTFLKVNRAFCQILGYSEAELLELTFQKITHPDDLQASFEQVGLLHSGAIESFHMEKRYLHRDGHVVWALLSVSMARDESGEPLYTICQIQDITPQRVAREQLEETATLLRIAGRVAHLGGWTIQLPDRDLTWSDENCIIHDKPPGYKPTLEEGINYYLPEHRAEVMRHVEACERDGTPYEFELPIVTGTGRRLWVHSVGEAVRDADGKIIRLQGAFQDITARKQLEAQLLRSQRMESIGTLAGGIAHDFNNLLAPIVMGISVIQRLETRENVLKIVRNMERSANRGRDLVRQVLSFAKGAEGQRVPIQLAHIVSEVASIMEGTFPKNITFGQKIATDLWPVIGDPTQLDQVLLNLCLNARDAMPDGGQLLISARNVEIGDHDATFPNRVPPGRFVELEVTDDGCGMPAEVVGRAFEPFFTTKGIGKGSGLGLSTVVGIVKGHGGFVSVESEVGRGTTFRVCLPADVNAVIEEPKTRTDTSALPRGRGEMILIVDDEAAILDVTRQTLETFGYRAIVAENGANALALYLQHRSDIAAVITDMMMPIMDGPALIASLCALDPDVRIIAASGLVTEGALSAESMARVKHFLAKPYAAEQLLVALRALLEDRAPADRSSCRKAEGCE